MEPGVGGAAQLDEGLGVTPMRLSVDSHETGLLFIARDMAGAEPFYEFGFDTQRVFQDVGGASPIPGLTRLFRLGPVIRLVRQGVIDGSDRRSG